MRNILIVAALLLSATSSFAFNNEPNGFRGLEWGQKPPKEDPKFLSFGKDGLESLFKKKNENPKIGNAEITTVIYGFWKNEFYVAYIETRNPTNKRFLLEALREYFGQESNKGDDPYNFLWVGTKTDIFVTCNSITDNCAARFSSIDIKRKKKELEDGITSNPKKDL